MSFSSVIDTPPRKRRHSWQPTRVGDVPAQQCADCFLVQRTDTREVWHDGGWCRVAVPRCGDSVRRTP